MPRQYAFTEAPLAQASEVARLKHAGDAHHWARRLMAMGLSATDTASIRQALPQTEQDRPGRCRGNLRSRRPSFPCGSSGSRALSGKTSSWCWASSSCWEAAHPGCKRAARSRDGFRAGGAAPCVAGGGVLGQAGRRCRRVQGCARDGDLSGRDPLRQPLFPRVRPSPAGLTLLAPCSLARAAAT